MNSRTGPARIWKLEIAWLLGSWAFSWVLLSQLLGYDYLGQPMLDIQMHNTFFVVQPLLATASVFLPVATVVTGGRALAGAFRRSGPNVVLLVLASFWVVLGLLVAVLGMLHHPQRLLPAEFLPSRSSNSMVRVVSSLHTTL